MITNNLLPNVSFTRPVVVTPVSRQVSVVRCQQSKTQTSSINATEQVSQDQLHRRGLLLAGLAASTIPLQLPAIAADAPSAGGAKVFFDMNVNGESAGRIVVELFGDVSTATQRFLQLVQGLDGVSFRRTRIEYISPDNGYFTSATKKELSRRASGRVRLAGGSGGENLEDELAARRHSHNEAGVVSIEVLDDEERETKEKLVAIKGQFVTVTETFGEIPNGSALTITCKPEPALDATNVVVGRVIQGLDVVEKLAALPRVKDNSGSPFFKAGKASGDKRANVAERAFGKPFGKIVIQECGLL